MTKETKQSEDAENNNVSDTYKKEWNISTTEHNLELDNQQSDDCISPIVSPQPSTTYNATTYTPYYVRAFFIGIHLGNSSHFTYLFTTLEQSVLQRVKYNLSSDAIRLLARIQRRRRISYFRRQDLIQRYQKDMSEQTIDSIIEDLSKEQLVVVLTKSNWEEANIQCNGNHSPRVEKSHNLNDLKNKYFNAENIEGNDLNNSIHKDSHSGTSSKLHIYDPLWSISILSVDEITELTQEIGGDVQDMWKRFRNEKKYSKRQFILSLKRLCSTTTTLSSTTLYTRVMNTLFLYVGQLITIPIPIRRLFQKLEILLNSSNSSADTVDFIDSFSYDSDSLLQQCQHILNNEILPDNYCIESGVSQVLFSLGYTPEDLTIEKSLGKQTMPLFDSKQAFDKFEAARFIQKAVENAIIQKEFEQLLELAPYIEKKILKFIYSRHIVEIVENSGYDLATFNRLQQHFFLNIDAVKQFKQRFNHRFLCRFTPEWLYAFILWEIVNVYESYAKNYQKAVDILQLLLRSQLVKGKMYHMYNRLTVNYFSNLQQPQLALEAGVIALSDVCVSDKSVPTHHLIEIAQRMIRILRACFPKWNISVPKIHQHMSVKEQKTPVEKKTKNVKRESQKKFKRSPNVKCHTIKKTNVILRSQIPQDSNNMLFPMKLSFFLPLNISDSIHTLLSHRARQEDRIPFRIIPACSLQRPMNQPGIHTGSNKHNSRVLFLNSNDEIKGVEEFALEWYGRKDDEDNHSMTPMYNNQDIYYDRESHNVSQHTFWKRWVGLHDEGQIIRELFGILMCEELLNKHIPNVFLIPFQTAPLDLFTETFYINRKDSIDTRLEYLSQLTHEELFLETLLLCYRFCSLPIIGVSWKTLQRFKSATKGRQWWYTFMQGVNTDKIKTYIHDEYNTKGRDTTQLNKQPSYNQRHPLNVSRRGTIKPFIMFQQSNKLNTRSTKKKEQLEAHDVSSHMLYDQHNSILYEQIIFLSVIAAGIGSKVLSSLFRTLCQNYLSFRSGLPDLILWRLKISNDIRAKHTVPLNTIPTLHNHSPCYHNKQNTPEKSLGPIPLYPLLEVLFSEVKSEKDHLSEKQRHWLSIILDSGGACEVVHIQGNIAMS